MTDVKTIDTLEVYLLANELSDEVWNLVSTWNYFEKDTIGKQMVRSCDSISANIAEGYGRFSYKENRQFCFYARGSILETKTWLLKAKNRNLIEESVYENLFSKLEVIHIKLNAYMKYIGKTKKE
jgi:four helix bundle protein